MCSVSSSIVQLQLFSQKIVLLAVRGSPSHVPPTRHGARDPSRFSGRAPSVVYKGTVRSPVPRRGRRRQAAAGARRSHSCCHVPAPGAWGRGRGVAGSCDGSGFSSVLEGRLGRTDSSSMFVSEFECFSRSPDTISLEMDLE